MKDEDYTLLESDVEEAKENESNEEYIGGLVLHSPFACKSFFYWKHGRIHSDLDGDI